MGKGIRRIIIGSPFPELQNRDQRDPRWQFFKMLHSSPIWYWCRINWELSLDWEWDGSRHVEWEWISLEKHFILKKERSFTSISLALRLIRCMTQQFYNLETKPRIQFRSLTWSSMFALVIHMDSARTVIRSFMVGRNDRMSPTDSSIVNWHAWREEICWSGVKCRCEVFRHWTACIAGWTRMERCRTIHIYTRTQSGACEALVQLHSSGQWTPGKSDYSGSTSLWS